MSNKIRTILNEGTAEIVEKKSRFIANVRPVKTEEEARAFIEEIKKKYYDARHNVFAYQTSQPSEIQRFSDDGEPQGTAGMPVLSVLTGEEIKNCCIVVTRYFGGTLLGTGGLVRAYGKSAKEAILNAGIAELTIFDEISIVSDYTLQGKIQYALAQNQHIIKDTLFTDKVEFIVLAEEEKTDTLIKELVNLTSGKAEITQNNKIKGAFVNGELKEVDF
ncbi:MAG: YigZ family protein [Anaerotignaceae bacterium]